MSTAAGKITKQALTDRVVRHIKQGDLDDHLEAIVQACVSRRQEVHDERTWRNMDRLNYIGKRVRITKGVKPKYMVGKTGTVSHRPEGFAKREGLIYVDLGTIQGRRGSTRYGPVVGIPAACLEEV